MSTKEIVELVILAISLLISFIGLITAFIKAIKTKKWDSLKAALCTFMEEAENLSHLSGQDKKNYVLDKAEKFCAEHGFNFDIDKVSSAIETLIDITKKVNQREKDKIEQ